MGDRLNLTYEYTVCGFVKLTVGKSKNFCALCLQFICSFF